jgi:F-type H+-transporting ATPase subunit epsilon
MPLNVELVSAQAPLWSGQASFVSAPTVDGSIGLYPRHQPLLALLGQGQVRIDSPDGSSLSASVNGGFLAVDSDNVRLVTDRGALL